jgi:hypothetical protein
MITPLDENEIKPKVNFDKNLAKKRMTSTDQMLSQINKLNNKV